HAHGAGQALVHGETQPGPVARAAQRLELIDDRVAVALLPLPHALDERLAPDGLAIDALARQFALHHHLGGDARVVGTGEPQGLEALHPRASDDGVLDGENQRVAGVQGTRHVRRWHDDAERAFAGVRPRAEVAAVLPLGVRA